MPELSPTTQTSQPLPSSLSPGYGTVLMHWEAMEHDPFELGRHAITIITAALIATVAYALVIGSPLMAITFILIGIVGYLSLTREPRLLDFFITSQGIVAGNEFYDFENLRSFWVYDNPLFADILSFKTKSSFVSYIHIPIRGVNSETVRNLLSQLLPEKKHEPTLVDIIERMLHN